ncbi:hypothetical protein [Poritiphilus flavus]|uniref:Uncharacterized protein n=1 Tax=Poritiphilus flavus TaxID=2697053 RepID=A0A6L9E9V0_9FLAO|nr:hypothetical protein [Poritiphilus flavus]NAS11351.1 hypothetical protein [Poritiphilus flavus]
MKTKQTIYFLLIIGGALIMATGNRLMRKEYALSLGIVLLMFGIYKSSQSWGKSGDNKNTEE